MKKILKPWVRVIKDFKNYTVAYDLLHMNYHVFPVFQEEELPSELAFSCDEEIYLDKLKIGSELDKYITFGTPLPPLLRCDIVLGGTCSYHDICPVSTEEVLLFYPCESCYIGSECSVQRKLSPTSLKNLALFAKATSANVISIVGAGLFRDETFQIVNQFIKQLNRCKTETRDILLNIPCYDLLQNYENLEKCLFLLGQQMDGGMKMSINFSLFHKNDPDYYDSFFHSLQKIFETGILSTHPRVTFIFDLGKWAEVKSLLEKYPQFKTFPTLPAPYIKVKDFSSKEILHDSKDLFLNYFRPLNVEEFTLFIERNFIKCMYLNVLADKNREFSNCKGYWLDKEKSEKGEVALKKVYENWMWTENEMCHRCALKGGCIMCRAIMRKLIKEMDDCILRDSILGGCTNGSCDRG